MTQSNSSNSLKAHSNTVSQKTYPCPQCQKATQWQDNPFKPFCSDRCKLIDFGAWTNEEYSVPAEVSPFSNELE